MASSSKPTGVHFALVFFVMATLILFILWYLGFKEQTTLSQSLQDATSKAESIENENRRLLDDLQTLRGLLGVELEQVGGPGEGGAGANTIYSAVSGMLVNLGQEQVQPSQTAPTVAATLQSMRTALDSQQTANNEYQQGSADQAGRLRDEQKAHRDQMAALQAQAESSEADLQKMITDQNEKLSAKDREIQQTRNDLNAERTARTQIEDQLTQVRQELEEDISKLETANNFLQDQLSALENLSFDKPDGKIIRIENSTRRVWINLGKRDNLRSQVTFSVYVRGNRGVGRGREDIKAKIEVSEIQGPHLAECLIIQEDFDRPIQEGDPIYSPLFEAGQKEYFSFVGILDLDGKEGSDRETLHNIIDNAGGAIEIEVDDQGNRNPPGEKMTIKSKFLVVGELPNPDNFAGFEEKRNYADKIQQEQQALREEARQQGIRIIPFPDFLNFIGYEKRQRLFVPGETRPITLQSGARSSSTGTSASNPTSTGRTSGRYRQLQERFSPSNGN